MPFAQWLNQTFASFDGGIFGFFNSISSDFLTGFMHFISLIGEKGLIVLIPSVILMLFAKTRKLGFCMALSVAVGALFTNITLKNLIDRPRPFLDEQYRDFWLQAGHFFEDKSSFPSGHTTSVMAGATALFLCGNKKWSWFGFIVALLMGISRIYLVAHYPTDVIAGLVVGAVAGVLAFFLTKLAYKIVNNNAEKPLSIFIIHSDVRNLFIKKNK